MRKLMTMVVGVAALCGMTAFAQTTPPAGPMGPGGMAGEQQSVMGAHRDFQIIHRALMEGKHDPALLPLVTKALTDRTALLNSELAHVTALQAVVTALQGGDETAIKAAREAAKTAMETVVTNAKAFSEDCKAIRAALPPRGRHEPGAGSTPGATNNS